MNVTLWFCGFPNDCHGYFPTQRVAMRWMHAIRKEKFAELDQTKDENAVDELLALRTSIHNIFTALH